MKFENLIQVTKHFSDENVCREHLENLRWANGIKTCPHCGSEKEPYSIEGGKRYKCSNNKCYKKFSAISGTIFENTKIKLNVWFIAIYLITSHKKGISSLQLSKDLGVTQKTAWFILHRIREMLKENAPHMLKEPVEIDETYVGGKEKNKHRNKREGGTQGRSTKSKTPVVGLIERQGKVVAYAVTDTKRATVMPIMRNHVNIGSTIYTDEARIYSSLKRDYKHSSINHGGGQYVNHDVHTNTIENFWSLFKRGVIGIYHFVSPKHLQRYVDEFTYRHNARENCQEFRFDAAIRNSVGRRLTFECLKNG